MRINEEESKGPTSLRVKPTPTQVPSVDDSTVNRGYRIELTYVKAKAVILHVRLRNCMPSAELRRRLSLTSISAQLMFTPQDVPAVKPTKELLPTALHMTQANGRPAEDVVTPMISGSLVW